MSRTEALLRSADKIMTTQRSRTTSDVERDLIADCLDGEPEAWRQLYVAYRPDAWRILCRLLGPADELEDLVQQVFLKVYRSLKKFEGRSRFSTWLYRICVHVAMDHLRRKKRSREVLGDQESALLADPAGDPSAILAHKRALARLYKALSKLKEDKRNAVILHDLMEVSTEEIARQVGIPPATVRTRLFHARRELAKHLWRQKGWLET